MRCPICGERMEDGQCGSCSQAPKEAGEASQGESPAETGDGWGWLKRFLSRKAARIVSVLIVAVIIPAVGAVRTNGRINTYHHMAEAAQALYERSGETPWPVVEVRHDYNSLMGRSEGTAFFLAVENDSDVSYADVEFVLSVYTKRGRLRGTGRIGVEIVPAGETVEFPRYLVIPGVQMKKGDYLVLEADREVPFAEDWRERFPDASFQVEEDLELLTGAVEYTGREDLAEVRVAFVAHSPEGAVRERFWCEIGCLREGQQALYRHGIDSRSRELGQAGESEEADGTVYRMEGISYTRLEEGLDAWQDSLEFREGPVLLQDATPLGESGPLVRGTVVNTTDRGILGIDLVVGAYNLDGQKVAEHRCRNYGEGGTGFFPGSLVEVAHHRYFYTGDVVYRLESIVL